MRDLLERRFGGAWFEDPHPHQRPGPARKLIDAFRSHFDQANRDIALFHFSGHPRCPGRPVSAGRSSPASTTSPSSVRTPPGTAPTSSTRISATLISRSHRSRRPLHDPVILDSCHSGSGTRDLVEVVRGIPARAHPQDSKHNIVARSRDVGAATVATGSRMQVR